MPLLGCWVGLAWAGGLWSALQARRPSLAVAVGGLNLHPSHTRQSPLQLNGNLSRRSLAVVRGWIQRHPASISLAQGTELPLALHQALPSPAGLKQAHYPSSPLLSYGLGLCFFEVSNQTARERDPSAHREKSHAHRSPSWRSCPAVLALPLVIAPIAATVLCCAAIRPTAPKSSFSYDLHPMAKSARRDSLNPNFPS